MEKLFVLSREFLSDAPNYIVGTGRFALLQFTTMLQENVYIDNFCSFDESKSGMKIMNKEVINIKEAAKNTKANFIIAEDDYNDCNKKLADMGITNTWVDIRMYSLINDCVWTFM